MPLAISCSWARRLSRSGFGAADGAQRGLRRRIGSGNAISRHLSSNALYLVHSLILRVLVLLAVAERFVPVLDPAGRRHGLPDKLLSAGTS
jgi:hypothetical protein